MGAPFTPAGGISGLVKLPGTSKRTTFDLGRKVLMVSNLGA